MKKNFFFKRKFNFKTPSAFTLVEISVVIIIVGILVAGISQAIEMFSETSLISARNLSKSSRITRTKDLALWLDATSDKAFDKEKNDKTKVSIWKDTNPTSNSPASSNISSESLYPSYILSGISSLPAVRFKKTSATVGNCVTIPNQSFVNNSEDFTLYLTYSPLTLDDGIIIEKNNATATSFPFSLELNSGFYKFSVKDSSNTISVTGAGQAQINTPNLIRLSRTKGSQIEISINGVSSTQSDTLTSSTFNDAELSIGCRNGATPTNFINGDVGETSFFNRNLNIKEKTDIEEYLYKKWKMKKNEVALASQNCTIPNTANTTADNSSVSPTSTPVSLTCKTGYTGSVTYTCSNTGVISLSGSCTINTNCTIPNTANTTADNSSVSPTSTPVSLTCKTGYTGSVTYTCSNTGVISLSGSCTPVTTCTYTETGSGNSQCLSTVGATMTFNANDTGVMLCPYGSGGSAQSSPPQRDMKYRCNSDGTMQYSVKPRCYMANYPSAIFNSKHPTNTYFFSGSTYYYWVSGREGPDKYTCLYTLVIYNQTPNYWGF